MMQLEPAKSPRGRPLVRMQVSGTMTVADAAEYKRAVTPGGTAHGLPVLGLIDNGTEIPVEVRKSFAVERGNPGLRDA